LMFVPGGHKARHYGKQPPNPMRRGGGLSPPAFSVCPQYNPHLDPKPMKLSAQHAQDLIERLSRLTDPRRPRVRRRKIFPHSPL